MSYRETVGAESSSAGIVLGRSGGATAPIPIWTLSISVAHSPLSSGPISIDPHQAVRLADATRKQYCTAGQYFTDWVRSHKLIIHDAASCDDLLVEWKNSPDGLIRTSSPTPNHFAHAIACVEWVSHNGRHASHGHTRCTIVGCVLSRSSTPLHVLDF